MPIASIDDLIAWSASCYKNCESVVKGGDACTDFAAHLPQSRANTRDEPSKRVIPMTRDLSATATIIADTARGRG